MGVNHSIRLAPVSPHGFPGDADGVGIGPTIVTGAIGAQGPGRVEGGSTSFDGNIQDIQVFHYMGFSILIKRIKYLTI